MKSTPAKRDLVTIPLSCVERLTLLVTLPGEGGIATARLVAKLRERLSLTAEENTRLGVTVDGNQIKYDQKKDRTRSFGFSGFELGLIVARLQKLDKEEKLVEQHVSLWDKFVDGSSPAEPSV